MSYKENDNSQHDDDYEQENSEGISTEQQQQYLETSTTASVPHTRSCTEGYTFCFTLWNQTSNGTRLVKQGKKVDLNISPRFSWLMTI